MNTGVCYLNCDVGLIVEDCHVNSATRTTRYTPHSGVRCLIILIFQLFEKGFAKSIVSLLMEWMAEAGQPYWLRLKRLRRRTKIYIVAGAGVLVIAEGMATR